MSVILSGALHDSDGAVFRAGDELIQHAGTQHELVAEGDAEVIYVARAMNGIEVRPAQ